MKRPAKSERDDGTRWRDVRRSFEERWRRWAERPPRTPPETAARQVLTRLDRPEETSRRAALRPGWRLAAAAVLALAVLGLWLVTAGPPSAVPPSDTASDAPTESTPVMADGVVLMWLDAETPLYMTFAPPRPAAEAGKGEGS